jgi:hypothetical protein
LLIRDNRQDLTFLVEGNTKGDLSGCIEELELKLNIVKLLATTFIEVL